MELMVYPIEVPTLPLAVQPLSAFHADLEVSTTVIFVAQISLRGKERFLGASAFGFTGSSVGILICFDKTYLHNHNTEAAAEEIPSALRI